MDTQVVKNMLCILSDEKLLEHAEASSEYIGFGRGCQNLLHDLMKEPASRKIIFSHGKELAEIFDHINKPLESDSKDEKEKNKSRRQNIKAKADAIGNVQGKRNMVGTGSANMTQTKGGKHIRTQNNNAPKVKKAKVVVGSYRKSTHKGHNISARRLSNENSFNQ